MNVCHCTLPHYNPNACDGCPNNRDYDSVYITPWFDGSPVIVREFVRLTDGNGNVLWEKDT